MPYYVVQKIIEALNGKDKSIKGAKILVLGLSYKKDVDDPRESPSLKIMELLEEKGTIVNYNDPYIAKAPKMRKHEVNKESVPLTKQNILTYDCVIIATDHSPYNADFIAQNANLIFDTRNLIAKGGIRSEKVIKA